MPATVGLGQAKARTWELSLGLSCGWHGLKYLSYHLLPLKVCISRKLQLEAESGLGLSHSDRGCRHPRQCLDYCGKCLANKTYL